MAFLCPSRLGYSSRAKRNNGKEPLPRGRITGSDSVETIEQVGLSTATSDNARKQLVIIQDFTPKAPGEVSVKTGETAKLICIAKDWLYIEKTNGQTGYVPQSACLSDRDTEISRSNSVCSYWSEYSADLSQNFTDADSLISRNMSPLFKPTTSQYTNSDTNMDVTPFHKTSHGQYIVLFDFLGLNENDVSVERAELVEVLNIEDPDWSWVKKYDGLEGFVPKTYICPVEPLRILVRNGGINRKTEISDQHFSKKKKSNNAISQQITEYDFGLLDHEAMDIGDNCSTSRRSCDISGNIALSRRSCDSDKDSLTTLSSLNTDIVSVSRDNVNESFESKSSNNKENIQNEPERFMTNQEKAKSDPFQNVTEELAVILKKRQQIVDASMSDGGSGITNVTRSSRACRQSSSKNGNVTKMPDTFKDKKISNMVEFVLRFEYNGQSHGQQNIYVQKGEAVYADLNAQSSTEWIWVFIPRTNQYGYIPVSYAEKQKTVVL